MIYLFDFAIDKFILSIFKIFSSLLIKFILTYFKVITKTVYFNNSICRQKESKYIFISILNLGIFYLVYDFNFIINFKS